MATPKTIAQEQLNEALGVNEAIASEVGKVFVGSNEYPRTMLMALIARGHILVEGVPGVAKTTLVKAFAASIGCSYRRIQFTPDLMPSDITGTYVLDVASNRFELRPGPIFSNIVLGDEINRAPAKTQSALLEAMQEHQVTIEGTTRRLPQPFVVLATQNPLEHSGTYPLPEAQVDRFLVKITMGYPRPEDEKRMLITYDHVPVAPTAVVSAEHLLRLQSFADDVFVAEEMLDYIIALTHFTRTHPQVSVGASPRASLGLLRMAKARALVLSRDFVLPDDIQQLAQPVLAHRIVPAPDWELEPSIHTRIIEQALAQVRYRPPASRPLP